MTLVNLNPIERIQLDEFSVLTVTDPHFHHLTPESRLDNYPDTCIAKLQSLRQLAISTGSKFIIFLGDVFHKPKQPVEFLNKIIAELLKFKENNITLYSIVGNHDIYNDLLTEVDKSALNTVFLSGAMKPLGTLTILSKMGNIIFKGYHFPNKIEPIEDNSSFNIAVAHSFYNMSGSDNITEEELNKLGYKIYLLGHDHVEYPIETVETVTGKAKIIRSGSFTRGTAHKSNLSRGIKVGLLEFNDKLSCSYQSISCKPPEQVFVSSAYDKVDLTKISQEVELKYRDLVTKLYSRSNQQQDVYQILDESNIQVEIKKVITSYLEAEGILRK